jgi:hypothetical protein
MYWAMYILRIKIENSMHKHYLLILKGVFSVFRHTSMWLTLSYYSKACKHVIGAVHIAQFHINAKKSDFLTNGC